ncbi:hypothetical protein FJZ20_02335 [Candidatus Pacearchaeota archaeon]|nr:hypothetical protein [Candidatus Pacearchaeota archaeon]
MTRYICQEIDKAEVLEKYVKTLAEKTNKSLRGAEFFSVNLIIRPPFEIQGKNFFNGFVGMNVRFACGKPLFLNKGDENIFYLKLEEKKRRFGFTDRFEFTDKLSMGGLEYLSIDFEEPTEEDLYALTSRKKDILEDGFDRVKKYAESVCSAVEDYSKVIQTHLEEITRYLSEL